MEGKVSPWCCWLLLQVWSYRVAVITRAQPSVGSLREHSRRFRTARITGGVVGRAVIRAQQGAGSGQAQQGFMEKLPFLVYWKNYSRPPGRYENRTVQRVLCTEVV